MRYASVAINIPLDKTFTYRIPASMEDGARVGKRVWVQFGPRRLVGYIVDIKDKADIEDARPVESVIDKEPLISEELLSLTKWISDYYICSWGEAIDAAIPGVLKKGKVSIKPRNPFKEIEIEQSFDLEPTDEQRTALKEAKESIDKAGFQVLLLHGITASGKTEVYLQAISHALKNNKSSIVLVPEIALTPQTVERFKSRFGQKVAVMHSGLIGSMRFREYNTIREGKARIVVGARSAIFAPIVNLGLIIIDEEHETSYKQETAPRYHAREVAIKRAKLTKSTLILGSATPSLESYYKAEEGRYRLVELTRRIKDMGMPKVNIIDMRKELYQRHYATIFSRPLLESLQKTLERREQAMLFLNRRGFSTFVHCRACGAVLRCKKCDAVMVYHYSNKRLVCHYCNWKADPAEICPRCGKGYVRYGGTGTERVESELHRHFPEEKTDRMDTDTTKKKGSHDKILSSFKRHSINILVGTQMIAKGLDFPKVTLVGVISADTALNLPDFRSAERTFNLLTQVAGRAGRGKEGGRVIIQTYTPDHYAIITASGHDYRSFYKKEIKTRRELGLPPFMNLIRLTFLSRKEEAASKAASEMAAVIKKCMRGVKILGPAPAVISKVRNRYRWNLIVKTKDPEGSALKLKDILNGFKRPSGVFIITDVDPVSL